MDRRRLKFTLAAALFAGWVFVLGAMAVLSGDRPQVRKPAPTAR